ncbi:MAG TPA: SDR family NAD(P)-dependent oxidoreductase, partial [Vicinamibacterales bacterium]
FGVALHNLYGPTEATVDVTWQPCSPWTGGAIVPIGRPIANTTVYILDSHGSPTPIGVTGEIHLGGPQLARGYVNRPALTRDRFIPNPFKEGGRLYRSGDLGRWRRDGTIEYLGRIDDQVKVRGQRIEPGEIEHVLETHPAVERAVVVPSTGQGLTELHGYVLARGELTAASLRDHLRDRVTDAMIPARFFRLDALPLTSSGKIDRKALTGAPLDATEPAAVENLSDAEAEIRAIWKTLLPDAEPGSRDGFFEVGGNSLLVIRLHERLNARWPDVWTVTDLFACATIADQARRVAPPAPVPSRTEARTEDGEDGSSSPDRGRRDRHPAPDSRAHAIAVVGMAVRLPGSDDLSGFWRDVSAGADLVRRLPAQRDADVRALVAALGLTRDGFAEGAYLDDIMEFDPKRLRLSPADAALIEPEQRLFLDTALRALEDAGRGGTALDGARVGVFVGGAPGSEWRTALMRTAEARRKEQIFVLNVPSNVATRLSFLHDWRGPAALFDTACSSTLVAAHTACRALRDGECDWALVGGAKAIGVPHSEGHGLSIDSSTGRTHAFDASADGTGVGEGCVVFLLRPLAHALADSDAIHGVILGSAINQDGASSGMAAPNPAAQAEVITAAAADAGISLSSLSYIEAHGTGTALGDPVEISGLTTAIARETDATGFAAIGAGKGNYGHLDGAAGALGLVRALMCLAHDSAPPQPFFASPNPRIDFAKAPVVVARELTSLSDRGCPRRAGVSAFGLSGINAHVVVEAAPHIARDPDLGTHWIAVGLSAPDAASLRGYAGAIVAALRAHPEWPLADIARTLVAGRDALDARLAVWARDRADLMARLAVFAAAPEAVDGMVVTGTAARARSGESVSAVHRNETAALAASTAFVDGARLVWPTDVPAGRVHLPAAPLARRRYAPDWVFAQVVSAHPAGLLGPVTIAAQGRVFPLDVHSASFWPVADHLLNGIKTLVGMAFPALVDEAMPAGSWRIHDLRWIRPLRPDDVEADTVTLSIEPGGAATLSGRIKDGRRQTFIKATVETADAAAPDTLDLDAVLRRCAPATDAPSFQRRFGVVEVSERWNCLDRVARGEHESVAWLHRPNGEAAPRLHPGMLDVAIGQALDEPGLVPTACGEIVVSAALPARPVAHIVRRATADGAEADVRLADPDTGRVAVAVLGLRFTRMGGARTPAVIVPSVPRWVECPLEVRDTGEPVVLIGEGNLADRLAAFLAAAGRLAGRSGCAALDDATTARIGAADAPAVVFVPAGGSDTGTRAVTAMRAVLAARRGPSRLLAVGEGAFAVGDDGPLDPFQALTYGIVAAATLEEATLTARYIDCDSATEVAALLAELAVLERNVNVVAWRGGRRLVRRFEPTDAKAEDAAWPRNGCCVVSGGTGGLSLMLAATLAAEGRVGLALLSRTGIPAGDGPDPALRSQTLKELRAAGLRLETYACDVADRASLVGALDRARREIGPITAVVHNAGVSDGSFLSKGEQSVSIYAELLRAKVNGALLLDELTASDPVEAFIMAGSLTALTGAQGFAAYTGANAFLDAFAAKRRRAGKPALTIDWCGIREMGMAARNVLKVHDIRLDATRADVGPLLRRALATGAAQVTLLVPEVSALVSDTPTAVSASVAAVNASVAPHTAKPAARGAGGNRALEAGLSSVWADVLGYESVAKDDDFYALGGDSITGMQIVEQTVRDLGVQMTLVDLFETANVAALADRLRRRAAEQHSQSQSLQPAPARDRYPVAWEQLAVLQAEAAADMGTAYNLPSGLYLPENVEIARLRAAVDALVERHEILRTRLVPAATESGEPTMEVLPPAPAAYEDLDCATDADMADALNGSVRPFDLWAGAPPVRFVLARVAGRPRALLLDVHHSLADAFSLEVLLSDLAAIYSGTAGPAPAAQFKDYAWWSREGAGAAAADEARAYWIGRFSGPLPVLDLPADHPRPPRLTRRAECVEFDVAGDVVTRLRAFAAERRTTPFAVVTAVWALLIARYARTEELVIAVAVNSRDNVGMAGMTGMLVSLLPLRLAVKSSDSVADFMLRTHVAHTDALGHRSYGLGRLLADLAPPSSPDRPTLSEVILSYMNFAEGGGQRTAGGAFTPFGLARKDGKSDLGIFVRDLPDQMVMAVEYNADLFDRDRMDRMVCHLRTLLAGVVFADPDAPVSRLQVLPEAERVLVIERFNATTRALDTERTIVRPFLDRVAAAPAAPAILWNGEAPLDYRGFAARAGAVARQLVAAGVRPGDTVAVCGPRSPDLLVAIYGILMAGAAYAPLGADQPAARIAAMLEDLGRPRVLAA